MSVDFGKLRYLRGEGMMSSAFDLVGKKGWESDPVAREFMMEWIEEPLFVNTESTFDWSRIESYQAYRALAAVYHPGSFGYWDLCPVSTETSEGMHKVWSKSTMYHGQEDREGQFPEVRPTIYVVITKNGFCMIGFQIQSEDAVDTKELLLHNEVDSNQFWRSNLRESDFQCSPKYLNYLSRTFTGENLP